MRFDLCVQCVLQKVLLFRETIHRSAILPFRETFRFACFAKNRDAKQTKRFAKRLSRPRSEAPDGPVPSGENPPIRLSEIRMI